VSAFRGTAGAPVINAAVENNSRPDPGAERGIEHVAKSHARAPDCFGQCRGIRVIVDLRTNVEGALHFRSQGKIPPAWQVRRIQDHTANWIERSGRANSDSGERCVRFWMLLKDGIDRALYSGKSRRRTFPRRHGYAGLKQNRASSVHQAGCNLCSADIYSEREFVSLIFGCLLLLTHLIFIRGQPEMAVPQENSPSL